MTTTTVRTLNAEVMVMDGPHRGRIGNVAGDRDDLILIYVWDRPQKPDGEVIAVPEAQVALYPEREALWEENQRLRRELEGRQP